MCNIHTTKNTLKRNYISSHSLKKSSSCYHQSITLFNSPTHQSMTLFRRADINPTMLKLSSEAVQSDRPAMIGRRDRFTNTLDLSPIKTNNTKKWKRSFFLYPDFWSFLGKWDIHSHPWRSLLLKGTWLLIRVIGLLEICHFLVKICHQKSRVYKFKDL